MARVNPVVGPLGVVASLVGLLFAGFSTHDYALHLDRRLHGTHCSLLPGIEAAAEGANACTSAMYSPYSSVLRGTFWGGIPISLFAVGAYAFFLAVGLSLTVFFRRAPRALWAGYGMAALTPLGFSALMAAISYFRIGAFCKLCLGMYLASILLGISGVLSLLAKGPAEVGSPPPSRGLVALAALGMFGALGLSAFVPAVAYAASLPNYTTYSATCGSLKKGTEGRASLLRIAARVPVKKALLVVDPLCPTCRALHDRLRADGVLERLDLEISLLPLDNECNWMLERPMHPGACLLARAVICGDKSGQSQGVLEWAYHEQTSLLEAGKTDKKRLRSMIVARFPAVDSCLDSKEAKQRLDAMLQFAVAEQVPVATPQVYIDEQKLCEEDTDLGLKYTLRRIAPELVP